MCTTTCKIGVIPGSENNAVSLVLGACKTTKIIAALCTHIKKDIVVVSIYPTVMMVGFHKIMGTLDNTIDNLNIQGIIFVYKHFADVV
jgi:hypothetical protein